MERLGSSDATSVGLPAQATEQTEVVLANLNPVWKADTFSYETMLDGSPINILRDEMRIEVRLHSRRHSQTRPPAFEARGCVCVCVQVYDRDLYARDDLLGHLHIPLEDLANTATLSATQAGNARPHLLTQIRKWHILTDDVTRVRISPQQRLPATPCLQSANVITACRGCRFETAQKKKKKGGDKEQLALESAKQEVNHGLQLPSLWIIPTAAVS